MTFFKSRFHLGGSKFADKMLCACSGEQFKFEETPRSPESLATRDFSASGLSSRTNGDWDTKFQDIQVDEVESTLKEALSLNYEEARALLGRLEYQRGNFDAALQVFQVIDVKSLIPRMSKAILERTRQRKTRSKGDNLPSSIMSMHSVSLLLEAIYLKAKSLEELGLAKEAARECKIILDTVESALPNGMPESSIEDCKLQEILHKALELLPILWKQAGLLVEAITAYRRALIRPWNLEPRRLAYLQQELATLLLYGGIEASLPNKTNAEEAILLLRILMGKVANRETEWDPQIIDHLTFALSISNQFEFLANHIEESLPSTFHRVERWFSLALCYSAEGQYETAINLLKKVLSFTSSKQKTQSLALLLGAKLCCADRNYAQEGIKFAQKATGFDDFQNGHFMGLAKRLLGICYGNAAKVSVSDSERALCQKEALNYLNQSALIDKEDAEVIFALGLENAVQRNLAEAFNNAILFSQMVGGSSGKGWKLLASIVSAEKRFHDAEMIVDIALDEVGKIDQLELLRLKAVLQIAQEQPKQAIETYRILLGMIQAQRELQSVNSNSELLEGQNLETEAWQDLANIYSSLGSWLDAEICVNKTKSIEFYSPRSWHSTGKLFEAQLLYKEALVALSISLSIEPDFVPSIVSTAEIIMKLGSETVLPIARSFLMNAVRLEPTNHKAWLNLGWVSKMEGSIQQAADYFQAAYELSISSPVQDFV